MKDYAVIDLYEDHSVVPEMPQDVSHYYRLVFSEGYKSARATFPDGTGCNITLAL